MSSVLTPITESEGMVPPTSNHTSDVWMLVLWPYSTDKDKKNYKSALYTVMGLSDYETALILEKLNNQHYYVLLTGTKKSMESHKMRFQEFSVTTTVEK